MERKYRIISFLIDSIDEELHAIMEKISRLMMELYSLKGAGICKRQANSLLLLAGAGLFKERENTAVFKLETSDIKEIAAGIFWNERESILSIQALRNEYSIIVIPSRPIEPPEREELYDITRQICMLLGTKERETALVTAKRKYQRIFEKSPTEVMILDIKGNVLEWSESAAHRYGHHIKEAPLHFRDFIYQGEIQKITHAFNELYLKGKRIISSIDRDRFLIDSAYREECQKKITHTGILLEKTRLYNRSEDKYIDAEYSVSLLYNEETGTIDGFLVTSTDITKRIQASAKLEESEKKYRELFKIITMFSILINTSGKTLDFNDISMKRYGFNYSSEGVTYMDFIFKDDQRKAASLFIDLYTNAIKIKNQWIVEKIIDRDQCLEKLHDLGIRDEPLRLINSSGDKIYETEFSANLWISEDDCEIMGALLSAVDVSERNLYRKKLEESEQKYRELVEEKTRDIIFSLDKRGRIITINKNIREKLGYHEEGIKGENIISILYRDPGDKSEINRETFIENLEKVLKQGVEDVHFKAQCSHKFLGEPVILQFKLDPVRENGRVTGVIGFASEISDDPLRQYLKEEVLVYEIESRLTIADEISYRITRNLQKYFDEGKISLLRLGLREMIVNAIEHGNLGITYEEKSIAQQESSYQKLLRKRQQLRTNNEKKVLIEYRLYSSKVLYTIKDEGPGFDYKKYFCRGPGEGNEQMLQHGRGILISRTVFDEMVYNEKGNEVNLTAFCDDTDRK